MGRHASIALSCTVAVFAASCSEGSQSEVSSTVVNVCAMEPLSIVETATSAAPQARIRVSDDGVWPGPAQGRVTASFFEDRSGDGQPAQIEDLGAGCYGVVSRSIASSDVEPLGPAQLAGARAETEFALVDRGEGRWFWQGVPFSADSVSLQASGGLFPAFVLELSSLAAFELDSSQMASSISLGGFGTVLWPEGDGDFVRVDVTPQYEQPGVNSGGQVTCFVQDRGCFELPFGAAAFLLASTADQFSTSLARVRQRITTEGEAMVQAERSIVWRFSLGANRP